MLGVQVWQLPFIVVAEEEPYIFAQRISIGLAKHNI